MGRDEKHEIASMGHGQKQVLLNGETVKALDLHTATSYDYQRDASACRELSEFQRKESADREGDA